MANYRAIATGLWSAGATWAGGAVPPDAAGHNVYSNGFTVTIDQNVNVALLTNAAITASFVGGGTSAAAGGSFNVSSASVSSIVANITGQAGNGTYALNFTALTPATLNLTGNLTSNMAGNGSGVINLGGTGTLTVMGNITSNGSTGAGANAINVTGGGTLVVNSAVISTSGNFSSNLNNAAINMGGAGSITLNNCSLSGLPSVNSTNGTITAVNCVFSASNSGPVVVSTIGGNRFSGTFISSSNGMQPISASRWFLNSTPSASYIQHALDGINASSYVRYYTADNALGQANPTDVRSGVSYASGNLTGRLTVPARGSVALSVNYGPSMPFTATRSGTTATATLAYSYPLVVGDQITVTGASSAEWNGSYTIASVISGTSVTFTVPNTHSATAGAGAAMQTTGTAVLDPAAVASAVWGAASRTITGGLVDTATTLTNAPTEAEIASQVRTELAVELARIDADISSRLAPSGTLATVTTLTNSPNVPSAAAIADEVRVELATELGRIDAPVSGATAPSAATVATAVRSELATELARVDVATSTRLATSGYTAPSTAPTAAANASAVRAELGTELGRLDATVSSRLASASYTAPSTAPTAAANASAVRTELATELARVDAAVSTRLASSAYTAPANSDVTAIKAKTDLLETTRLAQCSTVATTGAQLAAALS